MSQRSVEKLLGKILTDEDFRRSFFPVRTTSFELAASHGFELTPVERSALGTLQFRKFDGLARSIDPRISRCAESREAEVSAPVADGEEAS